MWVILRVFRQDGSGWMPALLADHLEAAHYPAEV
jgi:hypothetical protein